ncbi:MAG: tyrosine-type recombinase/integrase [Brevundimonas sp.]
MTKEMLTDRRVSGARADKGKRLELWDTRVPGLCLRVTDQGSKTWIYRYRAEDGRQPRFTIGKMPAISLKDARDQAADLAREVAKGGDPATDRKTARAAASNPVRTFNDLADLYQRCCASGEWMPKGKRKRKVTLDSEEGVLRRNIRPVFGKKPYAAITKAEIRSLLRAMTARNIGAQANKTHAVIRQVYNFAIAEDLVTVNPTTGVSHPATVNARSRAWTDAELRLLWSALSNYGCILDSQGKRINLTEIVALALKLAAVLGQRRGEIIGMEVSELDFTARTWTIPAERMKANRPHLVPLPDVAIALIQKAMAVTNEGRNSQSKYVFRTTWEIERPMQPSSLTHAMARVTRALNIPNATVHDLRRTMSSAMTSERLKISPFIRSLILAHAATGGGAAVSSVHYDVNEYVSEKRDALDRWARLLMSIVGESQAGSIVAPPIPQNA